MKNPSGYCQCGCGRKTPLSKWSRRGYKRGEPLLYIKGHSSRKQEPDYEVAENGCWIWQKHRDWNGYGRVWNGKQVVNAHRLYVERMVGPIAKGMEVHHRCGEPGCVNPAHLDIVSRREHMALEGRKAYGRYPVRI